MRRRPTWKDYDGDRCATEDVSGDEDAECDVFAGLSGATSCDTAQYVQEVHELLSSVTSNQDWETVVDAVRIDHPFIACVLRRYATMFVGLHSAGADKPVIGSRVLGAMPVMAETYSGIDPCGDTRRVIVTDRRPCVKLESIVEEDDHLYEDESAPCAFGGHDNREGAASTVRDQIPCSGAPIIGRCIGDLGKYLTLDEVRGNRKYPLHLTAKTELQNYFQVGLGRELPAFWSLSEGADHIKRFFSCIDVSVLLEDSGITVVGYGTGSKKSEAENLAAVDALVQLASHGHGPETVKPPPSFDGDNSRSRFNEVYQYYYHAPPRVITMQMDNGHVVATVYVENRRFEGSGFSKAKASQAACRLALEFIRGKYAREKLTK